MKKTQFVLLAIFIGFLFSSCATTVTGPTQGYADTIEEAHPDRFEKTVIGMDINEFKNVWPEAIRSGISEDSETYDFVYTRLYDGLSFSSGSYIYKIYTHFYFTNNKLVKYESEKRVL
jgi:hypothetical protein